MIVEFSDGVRNDSFMKLHSLTLESDLMIFSFVRNALMVLFLTFISTKTSS